jgi:hypothetical protein
MEVVVQVVLLAQRALVEHRAKTALVVHQAPQGRLELRVKVEVLEHQVTLVLVELLEQTEAQEPLVNQDHQGRLVLAGNQVLQVLAVFLVHQE